ncbi:hypothetical protein BDF19DRAFT_447254 [Syncephalis fuscata]|nr:hypothetical protein BDF19DRAFT_447254 [Syncephalis fuscata]
MAVSSSVSSLYLIFSFSYPFNSINCFAHDYFVTEYTTTMLYQYVNQRNNGVRYGCRLHSLRQIVTTLSLSLLFLAATNPHAVSTDAQSVAVPDTVPSTSTFTLSNGAVATVSSIAAPPGGFPSAILINNGGAATPTATLSPPSASGTLSNDTTNKGSSTNVAIVSQDIKLYSIMVSIFIAIMIVGLLDQQ